MKFTDLFIKRPVLAVVVNLVILIAGIQSIRALSVRQYPRSDIAVVRISTVYVGANADLVRGFITTPLERVIASADGIDYMESTSAQGLSAITVHLQLNYDTNAALTQIQAKVAQVRNDLPPEAEAPIIQLETADNQFAAMYLGFSSAELDQNQISDYLTRVVQPKLSALSGVQRADILGDRTFAMRIWLKPDQMAARNISPSALREALARNNHLSALGRTKGSMVSVNLTANTDLRTPEEFRQLVVKERNGVVVRLGDIADEDRKIDASRQQYIIAKRNKESSELRFRESVVQTVAAVKQTYWTLKASIANVTVQQRSLELAQELARQNKIRVDAGQIPPLDLVQAEAEVAQRRENLIRANTTAEDAEDRLRRLIMDPADGSFWRMRVDPIEEPPGPAPLPDVDAAIARAIDERYDLARARHDLDNAETNVDFFGNQRLPDVRLETSYRGSGLGGTQLLRTGAFPGEVTGTRSRSFGAALGQVFSPDYPTWSLGVTVSYPLGRSFEEAGLARAAIERRQAAQRIASLRLQVAETIRQAGRQVHSTAQRVDAARAGATLAQQRFDAEHRRYEVGLSTTFLVTQAQRDLLQAEVNLLQTTLDYESSLVNFEAVRQAPPLSAGDTVGLRGANIVLTPTSAPRGVFRPGAGPGFDD